MLIVCPSCATSYVIEPAALGAGGRMVRCARCKATWFAGDEASDGTVGADVVHAEAEAAPAGAAPVPLMAESEPPPGAAMTGESSESIESIESVAAPEFHEPDRIDDSPPLVPAIAHAPLADPAESELDSDDVETFAARRQRLRSRRKLARRTSRWTAVLLLLLAANVAVIGAREEVVRYLPQTASLFSAIGLPVNLRQLKFDHVALSLSDTDDGLIVHGTIISVAAKPVKVPELRFAARNATGQEIYTWTAAPSRAVLGPGERLAFRSELASPPADAKDVMVRFVMAHDVAHDTTQDTAHTATDKTAGTGKTAQTKTENQ